MAVARVAFIISIIMILSALFGVILMQTKSDYSWPYLEALCAFFAILCILLSCYHRRIKKRQAIGTIFHEILHWLGLFGVVFLVNKLVSIGVFGRYESSFMVLLLLAFATYAAGVYVDSVLMLVGALMALSGLVLAFFNEYLYSVFVPAIVLILAIWFFIIKYTKKHNTN